MIRMEKKEQNGRRRCRKGEETDIYLYIILYTLYIIHYNDERRIDA